MKSLPDLKRRGRKERGKGKRRKGRKKRWEGEKRECVCGKDKNKIIQSDHSICKTFDALWISNSTSWDWEGRERGREREREGGGGMKNNILIILYFKIRGSSPYITSFINECCSFTTQWNSNWCPVLVWLLTSNSLYDKYNNIKSFLAHYYIITHFLHLQLGLSHKTASDTLGSQWQRPHPHYYQLVGRPNKRDKYLLL